MNGEMRRLLVLIFCFGVFLSFSQKKKKQVAVIPETQGDSLKLEAVLIDAEKHLILDDYAKALDAFTVAQDMNSESGAINYGIAQVLSESGEPKKALPYGLRAIELSPDNKYYRLSLARTYQSAGFYIESAKVYEAMLTRFPADEDALYELAELYQLTGQTEEMFQVFDKIEDQLGVKEEIIREKQRIFMKEGELDKVIGEYRKLVAAYPDQAPFRVEFISFLIQNKKLEEASAEIDRYEKTEPTSSRITLLKSEVAWMKGDYQASLVLLKDAFASPAIDFESKFQIISNYFLASASKEEHATLTDLTISLAEEYTEEYKAQAFVGDMLYGDGEKETALKYYLKAVRFKPANFSLWQNILNIEGELSLTDSLIVHSEEALEYFPNQALLYYFAGTGHLLKKNNTKAIRMFDSGKKYTVDPNLLTVFYGQLGDAHHGVSEKEKSYQAYEKALANDPNNDHVLNNYSYYLSLDGADMEKALGMSTKLVDQHPDNPTYLDTHGWVLYVMGDYKESVKFLEKATTLGEDGTVIEHYGDVLFQLGDVNGAVQQWEKAKLAGGTSEFIDKKIAERKLYE